MTIVRSKVSSSFSDADLRRLAAWYRSQNKEERDGILSACRDEASALLTQDRAATTTGAAALATAITVLAAGAAYGVAGRQSGHQLAALVIPPVLALIATYLVQHHGDGIVMRAARRDLEGALEGFLGVPTLVYARYVADARKPRVRNPSLILTLMTYTAAIGLITAGVWKYVPTHYPPAAVKGHELLRDAGTIKVIAIGFTCATLVTFLSAGLETFWFLDRRVGGKVASVIRNSAGRRGDSDAAVEARERAAASVRPGDRAEVTDGEREPVREQTY